MANIYGAGLKGKATRLHSLIVRSRGACESCGESEYSKLQCAHIISRRYSNTRTLEANAFALCARCHMHYTAWPIEFAEFTISKTGEDGYATLCQLANMTKKMDWAAEAQRLQEVYDAIQAVSQGEV